jgi:hypothetical protein
VGGGRHQACHVGDIKHLTETRTREIIHLIRQVYTLDSAETPIMVLTLDRDAGRGVSGREMPRTSHIPPDVMSGEMGSWL